MTIGKRLAEERTRLGMTQTQFAEAAGLKSRRTLSQYEADERSPDAAALAAWAAHGVDVLYVLTGQRNASQLTSREAALLANYRASDAKGRAALDSASAALAQSGVAAPVAAQRKAG